MEEARARAATAEPTVAADEAQRASAPLPPPPPRPPRPPDGVSKELVDEEYSDYSEMSDYDAKLLAYEERMLDYEEALMEFEEQDQG